ncbi:hypothetical protein BLJ79_10820 [Arthrobacter sp. UCD-GKA]|uniref:hypothetical protein n=1 Tax=Arthrobacter sp. UCD-GKA TaxID=1913576 RepID=UPI0008DCD9AD|nr:hypothetical protein [Arthrobacter sp. UCD-GKA]OIH84611.1 hypothetical protein BLJ79_10820 [Arthrobacter sp. UCD-GKA]
MQILPPLRLNAVASGIPRRILFYAGSTSETGADAPWPHRASAPVCTPKPNRAGGTPSSRALANLAVSRVSKRTKAMCSGQPDGVGHTGLDGNN